MLDWNLYFISEYVQITGWNGPLQKLRDERVNILVFEVSKDSVSG